MKHPYEDYNRNGTYYSRFMDTVGDSTGSVDQSVNGSVTPVEFCVTAPADSVLVIHALTVTYIVTGKLDSGGYGNGAAALTNGIAVYEKDKDGDVVRDATFQLPIKTNFDWQAYSFGATPFTFGSGDESLSFKYDFLEDGSPVILEPGESYCIKVQDNLSTITDHHYARVGMVKAQV